MTNPILRPAHPAAPLTPVTKPLYDDCTAAGELLQEPGLDVEMRIWLVGIKGDMTGKIWNAARKAKLG